MNSISTLVFSLSFISIGEMLHMHSGVRLHQNGAGVGGQFLGFKFSTKKERHPFCSALISMRASA